MKRTIFAVFAALFCGAVVFACLLSAKSVTFPPVNPDGSINLEVREQPYVPQAGDLIRCGDRSNYTVTCVEGYEAFPLPTYDSPSLNLPEAEADRLTDISGDYLFIRNLHETRRMVYTLADFLKEDTSTIQPFLPADAIPAVCHTWDPAWAAGLRGKGAFCVDAWDIFKNGEFLYTAYQACRS